MKLSNQRKQFVARTVREKHGVEITPDEAERELNAAMRTIRTKMVEAGHPEFAAMALAEVRDAVRESLG